MDRITIPNTEIECSKFIFGTASLFNAGSNRRREYLLEAAIDNGFSHFDTAPSYGFGMAERDLSRVLKRHSHATVTTKVGLYSPGGEGQPFASVFLRKAAGRVFRPLSRALVDFSLSRAKAALEASLKRLGRDRIDLYLLHEPEYELVNTPEWLGWLESCVEQGSVRYFGVASTPSRIRPFLECGSPLCGVVQVSDSIRAREADVLLKHGRPLQITYGYLSDARRHERFKSADVVLQQAVERNRTGAIIVSTTKITRISKFAISSSVRG